MTPGDGVWLERWTARAWRRWRLLLAAEAAMWGAAAGLTVAAVTGQWRPAVAVALSLGAVRALGTRAWWTVDVMVSRVEQCLPLHNALVAWHESRARGLPVAAEIRKRLATQARVGLDGRERVGPHGRRSWTVAAAVLGLGSLLFAGSQVAGPLWLPGPSSGRAHLAAPPQSAVAAKGTGVPGVRVEVSPPAYLALRPDTVDNPETLDVIEGSQVVLSYHGLARDAVAYRGDSPLGLSDAGRDRSATLVADATTVIGVSAPDGTTLRAFVMRVVPDQPPEVHVKSPGRDVRPADATAGIPITVVARDDHRLHDLRVRFTTVSGSGETFTFVDGELPLAVVRRDVADWQGRAVINPAALGLGPGDSMVYFAVARDGRTSRAGQSESERYLVEIARPGELGGGDFSLPDNERRYALSQRMVIELTERLIARRAELDADAFTREAQGLAMHQRRVRAEFVFLMGGDVVDEVEEAEHSHEIEAGRLDNSGQRELLDAVRQMSLAEQQLTAGDASAALPFEYRALEALQAAFGRARYFMRTLPSRVAIDSSRRLSGDRYLADPSTWERRPLSGGVRDEALRVLGDLRTLDVDGPEDDLRRVTAALLALDTDPEWQAVVARLATASRQPTSGHERRRALDDLILQVQARVAAGAPARLSIPLPLGHVDDDPGAERRQP